MPVDETRTKGEMMTKYNVFGMSCAACQARVQNAVSKVDGVTNCSVNLLTNSMTVDGDVPPENVIKAVRKAGYDAAVQSDKPTYFVGNNSFYPYVFWNGADVWFACSEYYKG